MTRTPIAALGTIRLSSRALARCNEPRDNEGSAHLPLHVMCVSSYETQRIPTLTERLWLATNRDKQRPAFRIAQRDAGWHRRGEEIR